MRSNWRSTRGSQLVQLALVIPMLLLLLYGAFEVWRVMQARDGLQEGVYQAVLYLSTYGLDVETGTVRDEAWQLAREIVAEGVVGTGIVGASDLAGLQISLTYDPGELDCQSPFIVEAIMPLTLEFAPLARVMTLHERRTYNFQCEPPALTVEIVSPADGHVGCPSEVRFYAQCYTSPAKAQVRVRSSGGPYDSPWFDVACGSLAIRSFPPVPSGGWEITVSLIGGRSGLEAQDVSVSGHCP